MAFEVVLPEYLEVNNVPLATPAWLFPNVDELQGDPNYRGSDRTVPLLAGDIPYPRRAGSTSYTLEGWIFGDADWEGTPYGSAREGLEANVEYLRTNVSAAIDTGDGTVPAVLYTATQTLEADVHCGPLKVKGYAPNSHKATLRIDVPAGFFTVASV